MSARYGGYEHSRCPSVQGKAGRVGKRQLTIIGSGTRVARGEAFVVAHAVSRRQMHRFCNTSVGRVQKDNIRRLSLMRVSSPRQQEIMVGHIQQQVDCMVLYFGYDPAAPINSLTCVVSTVPYWKDVAGHA